MRILLLMYLICLFVVFFLKKIQQEIKYIVFLSLIIYIFLMILRITYPLFFYLTVKNNVLFLLTIFLISLCLRFSFIVKSVVILIKNKYPTYFSNNSFFINTFLEIVETKSVILRKILFSKNFKILFVCRKWLSLVNKNLLIFLFFLPRILFIFIFIKESLVQQFFWSPYLFSLNLIFVRIFPTFLISSLVFGNFLELYKHTVLDKICQKKIF